MEIIFRGVFAVLIAYGFYQILRGLGNAPNARVTKTIRNVSAAHRAAAGQTFGFDRKLAEFLSGFVRLNPLKRESLETALENAGLPLTPELYYAEALTACLKSACLTAVIGFVAARISSVLAILLILPMALYTVQATGEKLYRLTKITRERRRQIEYDLPRFVYSIVYELNSSHDVLSILERHKEGFSKAFQHELEVTIADMRSGNYEAALQRLESRVSSAALSEVTRGLIETVKGHDSSAYWETLALRFSEFQRQELLREAQKVPAKLKGLSFALFITIGGIFGVMIVSVIWENLNQIMG